MLQTSPVIRLAIVLITILLCCSARAEADGQAAGIDQFLDESGRLSLPEGFSGNLDPAGFDLMTASDGSPRFVARGANPVVPGDWIGFGGVNFGCNGTVTALATDASGMIYLGGDFTICGDTAANHVVAYDPVANQWHSLGNGNENGVDAAVYALVISGSDIYAAGNFSLAGGQAANRIARWDGSQWHSLTSGSQNGFNSTVSALAVAGGDLYAGGAFVEAGGEPANRVARWDGSQWYSLGSGAQNGVDGESFVQVQALSVDGGDIYVGGSFDEAGGETSNNIARWDGTQWHSLGSGSQNGVDGRVHAMVIDGDELFVGGAFANAGDQAAGRIARWDGSAWHALGTGSQNGVLGSVTGLGVSGGDLYVGGFFSQAGGMMVNYAARWDGSAWHPLSGDGTAGMNAVLDSLLVADGAVYFGGRFTRAGNTMANSIVRWESGQWQALGEGGQNGSNGAVLAVAVSGADIYIGGLFTWVGDISANHVARWDGSEWHALGNGELNGVSSGGSTGVSALAVSGGDLYVGGFFNQAGSVAVNNVARWDGAQWHSLGDGAQNGLSSSVTAIAVEGDDVYVGGYFTEAGEELANRVVRWDGSSWHSLGDDSENGVDGGRVEALAVDGNDVYVGGWFTEAGGQPASRVARWDGSSWHSLGDGAQNGVNAAVNAIVVAAGNVYVGGSFNSAGGVQASRIAHWDGAQWHPVGTHAGDGLNWIVRSLAIDEHGLYLGGSFTQAGTTPANRVARWNGDEWQSLGSGVDNGATGDVFAIAVSNSNVYTGGWFGVAGSQPSSYIAQFELALPLELSVVPVTILEGNSGELSVTGGFGDGEITVEVSGGGEYCSLAGTTLSAVAVGECTVIATKAADGEHAEQSASALVRVVADPGVNLVVELEELPGDGLWQARGQCAALTYRIRVRNDGPLASDEVSVGLPAPTGLLAPVDWACTVPGADCTPATGEGAVDVSFPLAIGQSAEIEVNACPDPNAAFADFQIQAGLPNGMPLVFPEDAEVNWSAPINGNGIFRTRFQ